MSRPLRLLWLIDSLNLGGAESLVRPFASGLDRDRIQLRVCCLKTLGGNPFEPELAAAGIPYVNLQARNLRDLAAFGRLLRLIRDQEIDLIHAHLNDATIWAGLAARWTRRPWVATLHVFPPASRWNRQGLRERLMLEILRRGCSRVISVSAALRDAYLHRTALRPEQLVVAHNGIEPSWFTDLERDEREALRRELDLPVDAELVVTVSVLRPGKGIEVLLEAARKLAPIFPDARFLLVGDGPSRQELMARCRHLGLDSRVRWTGARHDVARLLALGDLFVLPTLGDAFPTVILEAMGSGLPVIASRVGGVPEIIESPAVGRLVPAGDPEALARGLVDLLGRPAERRAMGGAARRRVQETFTTAIWIERLTRIYAQVAGDRWSSSSALGLGSVGSR